MRARPMFGYFGGKWRDALSYPAPVHGTIVEPFAGSAGYALRHNASRVVLCDLDPNIADLWSYLIGASQREILSIPDILPGQSVEDMGLDRGPSLLVGFWINSGTTHPCKRPSAWMRSGEHMPSNFWGVAVRQSISAQLHKIRHWEIYCCSYSDIQIGGPATWFIDPPYEVQGSRYRFGSKLLNFDHLGGWCRSRTGQVIVCEQSGASWLPFQAFKEAKTTRRNPSKEVIWTTEARP